MVVLPEKPLPLGSLPQFATIIWKECTRGGGVPIVRTHVHYSTLPDWSVLFTRRRMGSYAWRSYERVQRDGVHLCDRNVSSINYRAREGFIVDGSRIHRGPRRTRSRETRRRASWIEACRRC